uniref:CRAL-TRIO domain-containing protein n=1 Tax=Stomoxys calcitrans TaxID=35570 RepID=A0A1I8NP19_STOCA
MYIYGDVEEEKAVDALQQWFEDNKKLPKKIDRTMLWRLYQRASKDIEKTKKLIEVNYTLRLKNPQIFANRDPTDNDTNNTHEIAHIIPLRELTPSNAHVTVLHFYNPEPQLVHFTEDIKTFTMVNDCRFCLPDVIVEDEKAKISDGAMLVIDMEGVSLKFIMRFTFFTMNTLFKYLYLAYPDAMKAVHLINCPPFINKILALVKPFMSKELFAMITCHIDGLDSLYEHIPRDMLPNEYGGKAGKLADLAEENKKLLLEKRDFLTDMSYWKL